MWAELATVAAVGVSWLAIRWFGHQARPPKLVDHELVTLTGIVRAESGVTAPLSGRRCVIHCSHATVLDTAALPTLVGEPRLAEAVPFTLDFGTGVVHVDEVPSLQLVPQRLVPQGDDRERAF